MADNNSNKTATMDACPLDKKNENKLVKITELPLHGNPYPPMDVIQNDEPNSLELAVRSIRTTVQPYLSPICSAYNRTRDVLSIGVAHSQSAIENLRQNQSTLSNAFVISGAGILGLAMARRRGIIKKVLFSSMLAGVAAGVSYPRETKETLCIGWLMAKNKLPSLVQEQYGNLVNNNKSEIKPDQDRD